MKKFIQIENDINESVTLEITDKNQEIINHAALVIAMNMEMYCHIVLRTGSHYPSTYGKRHYIRKQEYYGLAIYIHELPTTIDQPYGTGYKAFNTVSKTIANAIGAVINETANETNEQI